ncbi:MAG TPA: hypothetical protein VNP94_02925 [Actinomycetota bacterium]|nr:hypothetical protein [Actinomycetota bacterium]
MDRLEALGRVPLFRGLSQRQRRRILKGTLDYRFGPGEELVREGEHGETLFVGVLAEEPRIAWAMLGALAGRLRGD